LPDEQAFAAGLSPLRRPTWIAGRLALAAALWEIGAPRAPLLATDRGAPAIAAGFVGSVSHKRQIAVALAARDVGVSIGVDVEELSPGKYDISRRVLTPAELAVVNARAAEERWREVLIRFSMKESIYKAVDPFVRRYVGFEEAEVDLGPRGEGIQRAAARLALEKGEGPFEVEASWLEIEGHVITSAVVRRA
jgi:4'-phosphopantetheinyl transferase EntD